MRVTLNRLAAVTGAMVALSGCGLEDEGAAGMDPQADPQPGIHGKLLHSIDLGPGHVVRFYDFGEGGLAVREESPIDIERSGGARVLGSLEPIDTLADAFRRLQPGLAVPATILEADRIGATRPAIEPEAASRLPERPPVLSMPGAEPETLAAQECSGDFFGDNWGAQWFLDNFCFRWRNSGQVACQTNQFSYDSGVFFQSKGVQYQQFEGDFTVAGSQQGWHKSCGLFTCNWVLDFWEPVPPRKVLGWRWINKTIHILGGSPCNHLGFVIQWAIPVI